MYGLQPEESELRNAYAFVRRHPFPAKPELIDKILDELRQPQPEIRKIVDKINSDVALAGIVVRSANSAAFGPNQIESVDHAVIRLGLKEIHHLVLAAYAERSFPLKSDYARQILHDSKEIARACLLLSAELFTKPMTEAYLAGLMLNSGAIFLAECLSERYESVYDLRDLHPLTINQIEDRRVGTNHAAMGYLFARHWNLPKRIATAVFAHHNVLCDRVEDEALRNLLAILKLAEHLVAQHIGLVGVDPSTLNLERVQLLVHLREEFMIDDERLADLGHLLNQS